MPLAAICPSHNTKFKKAAACVLLYHIIGGDRDA